MTRPITFLSDYGLARRVRRRRPRRDRRICPEARVIDLTHGIPRHDVLPGALVLARALPYMPAGVHLAVVDPEVGARRRAVALRTAEEDRLLVGPDNGLLMPAAERFGGVAEAVEISASPWRLEPVSATFHGRDLFAPVAARLAGGAPLGRGRRAARARRARHARAARSRGRGGRARRARGRRPTVRQRDRSTPTHADLAGARPAARRRRSRRASAGAACAASSRARSPTSRPGGLLLYEDAGRALALAVNGGDAAALLGLRPGDEVRLEAGVTLGRPRLHLRETTRRTTARASWPPAGAPHGTLVTAGEQTAGRGRQGRTWTAPPGSALLLSLVLRELDAAAAAARRPRGRRRRRPRRARQVAQRRAGRRPQGRGHPRRGRPAGGLGGARHRRQRRGRRRATCRPSCASAPARSAARRTSSSRRSPSCSRALERRLAEPADGRGAPRCASATRCSAGRSRGPAARARRGDRRHGRAARAAAPTASETALDAGEVAPARR